ncbi:MAG: branched-chain amino acid ABC transporter permease [Spirochaetales bacterium]|jgi:branched-chain amino acid transport system permease protein|nr:branched-chain amino acid ABC transporter permease [Spirochaetales bacterium]
MMNLQPKALAFVREPRKLIGAILLLSAVILILYIPVTKNRRLMTIGIMAFMYIALGESWNIGAMTGLFSIAHSAFFGLGVYGITITLTRFQGPVIAGILAGLILNIILAVIIGGISSKLSGLYFTMALIGLSATIYSLSVQWVSLTGGSSGISMPRAYLLPKRTLYFIALGIAVLSMIFYVFLRRSKAGTCFVTTRENPSLAAALGSNVPFWRILSTVLSASMAGLCGSFYAFHLMSNNSEVFSGAYSLKIMMVSIVGGINSVWGPVLGCLLIIMDEYIRGSMPSGLAPLSVVIYALILILMALVKPAGLASFFEKPGDRHAAKN